MLPTQSLLKRQLKRFFGNDFNIPVDWEGFIAAVDSAYADFEVDRELIERSMELSSQELLEANSEIRAIFQAIPDRVFRLDQEGTILSVKAGAAGELPQQELSGRRIQECWLKHTGDDFSGVLRRVIDEKSMISIEYSEGSEGGVVPTKSGWCRCCGPSRRHRAQHHRTQERGSEARADA